MNAPTRIGRYEIVRRLGKSMTDVYLAIDTAENRKVALKLIPCGGNGTSQEVMEAERRGAAIQKKLRALDPRMVEIYEFGEQDGFFFVAMQYVEGKNLAEELRAGGAMDATRAATIALEILEHLAKFHTWEQAVVHGDIKPSNIHLGHHDTVRLLDFGIAKTLRVDHSNTTHHFGSPGYCSPERLARSAVDAQSDLWAVGATLYEMLAGVPPYQAENTRKLENLIRSGRAPRALPARCPRALRAVVSKGLAPNPAQRYRSAREFQTDLQAFLEHKPTMAETERRTKWSPNSTMEAARAYLKRATQTVARAKAKVRGLKPAGALGWFALGMALWLGGAYTWRSWQARRVAAASLPVGSVALPKPQPGPAPPAITDNLASLYAAAGRRVLEQYRQSSDPSLQDFDWHKAEVCLERAVQLGAIDDRTLGELALSRGYATLERISGGTYSPLSAGQWRRYAWDQFALAAQKMPRSPDPHLALARVYVYSLPDQAKAIAEFDEAERLGAILGQREFVEQADAYRMQAMAKPKMRRAHRWR